MKTHNDILLQVRDLKTWFGDEQSPVRAVDGVSFDIRRGETFALLGESGCGKSMTALSLMQLLPSADGRIVSGSAVFDGQDLLQLSELEMRTVRGNRIAMIFQEPMTSLNPVLTVKEQIAEVLKQHSGLAAREIPAKVISLLDDVGIPDARQRMFDYPHQLSGGMKQRVMIACALASEPDLLIADEPTTALDVTIQAQVLELLERIQRDTGMAILLITHDLGIVADRVDDVAVMYAGQIIEQADSKDFFSSPSHPYTSKLFAALPSQQKRDQSLEVIEGSVPSAQRQFSGCRFADRCDVVWPLCHSQKPKWITLNENSQAHPGHRVRCHRYDESIEFKPNVAHKTTSSKQSAANKTDSAAILEARDLQVHFPVRKGLFRRVAGYVRAVDGIDLQLKQGQTLALVGESGCGKTTAGKALLQLIRPSAGSVQYRGNELTRMRGNALRAQRADLQLIFQDPFSSMNPRMMVGNILLEGMQAQGVGGNDTEQQQIIDSLLEQVGLSASARYRYPHEFSGGQRQRICIARALAVNPSLIVCDEPTSALDVSVQAQVLNLLKSLQTDLGLSYLFISHNLSVVEYLANEVAVMYLGQIVEKGSVDTIMNTPMHPYTQALLSAIPVIDKKNKREIIRLQGELPSPVTPPAGCHFHPRCAQAMPRCSESYPAVTELTEGHEVRCFLYSEKAD